MGPFGIATVHLTFLAALILGAGIEEAFSQSLPSMPAFAQPAVETAQQHPWAYRTDLKPEIEPAMFQGTVEAVDPSERSVTIRTDAGRTMILLSPDCQAITMLRTGDRVLLEADEQDRLTVTTVGEAMRKRGSLPRQAGWAGPSVAAWRTCCEPGAPHRGGALGVDGRIHHPDGFGNPMTRS